MTGENWNPDLRAPLSSPGIDVAEGDYLLEVNGRPLTAAMNIYSLFEGTAGRQTLLRVNKTPALEGSRVVTVVPVASEDGLRTRAWIEDNRRTVDRLSGGRLAYVWLPNTGGAGYTSFTRYYFAQQNKEGAVIDERYNHGGLVADYIVNELDRKLMGYFALRDGEPFTSPRAGILRAEGDDHQRIGGLRRATRCPTISICARSARWWARERGEDWWALRGLRRRSMAEGSRLRAWRSTIWLGSGR